MRPDTVLVADDDKFLAALIRESLQAAGLAVHLAHDGISALVLAKEIEPALIILDVMMPGKGGLEVLATIKSSSRLKVIPVIMLTASRGEKCVREAIEGGATDYVAKPFVPAALVRRVQSHLRGRPSDSSVELDG